MPYPTYNLCWLFQFTFFMAERGVWEIFSEKGKWITKCKTIKENIRISSRAIFRNGQKVNAKEKKKFLPLRVPNSLGIVYIHKASIFIFIIYICIYNGYFCTLYLLGFCWDSLPVLWYLKVVTVFRIEDGFYREVFYL